MKLQMISHIFIVLSHVILIGAVGLQSSYLVEKFGEGRTAGDNSLRCISCGFESQNAKSILDNLLGKYEKKIDANSTTVYDDGSNFVVFNKNGINDHVCDVAFVYAHRAGIFDEDSTIRNMQSGLKAILPVDENLPSTGKKMYVLVIEGPLTTVETAKNILEESWATLVGDQSGELLKQVVVHVVSVSSAGPISELAVESVSEILQDPSLKMKSIIDCASTNLPSKKSIDPIIDLKLAGGKNGGIDVASTGIDICREGIVVAMTWARDGANASLQRLQKLEAASEFATFIERLISGAHTRMRVEVEKLGGASDIALKLAEKDISRNIFTMLNVIYRRQIQLARQESAKLFNTAVGEDFELTAKVMDDLDAAKQAALRNFTLAAKRLTPKNAPKSTWTSSADYQVLLASLDEYITSRCDAYKMVGVIPRHRRPIDISYHVLLSHPLGRDYRQDPLSAGESNDIPFYDERFVKAQSPIVHPSLARALLESPPGQIAIKKGN